MPVRASRALNPEGKSLRVELVCPAAEDSAPLRSLAMALLAGLTPPGITLSFKDDILQRLNPETDLDFGADLAAITVSTKTAARAYELAASYRRRGVRVVLGGIHPTALPDEALEHADAVVVGEAEGLWERLLEDSTHSRLQRVYRHDTLPDFRRPPRPRRDIFRSRRYVPVHTVQASRGCPFACEFCSVTPFYGRVLRLREIGDLVQEIEELDRRWVMFSDDNILARPAHARELFRALAPLRLTWFGQASLQGLDDEENLRLLRASGCRALFVGLESVNPKSLKSCGKVQNDPARYLEIISRLHDHGIAVWASFVFGLDDDDADVFARTVEFALEARVFLALFALLTPYPGTRLYARLLEEERLLEPRWWLRPQREDYPLFRPRRMTPEQLHEGWRWAWREFYSGAAILRRLGRSSTLSLFSLLSFLPLNLHQRRLTEDKILGGNKFFLRDR
jgi:radical SAM superfamily enzyme YgiQ (UPF0313 family)